jgi:hypothetical protein
MVGAAAAADAEVMVDAFSEPEASVLHDDMVSNIPFCNEDGGLVCNICDEPYLVFYKHDVGVADDEAVPGHKNP